jgi:hypothetical protein
LHSKAGKKIFPVYTRVAEQPVTLLKVMDARVFAFPFFNQGVQQTSQLTEDLRMYGLEDLQLDGEPDLLQLKCFIFHTSHCGSTLLARMLGSLPGVRVVAETEAINGLLLSFALYSLPEEAVLVQLKQIMEAYRQPVEGEKMLVFKLTSWNVFFIRLFQQLYPDIPWIYLDRDTEKVVHSLLQKGGGFADWWDHPADIVRRYFMGEGFVCSNRNEYLGHMVERHRFFAQNNQNKRSVLLQYPEWIGQFERVILPHAGIRFSKEDLQHALQLKRYDSKQAGNFLFNPAK